MQYLIWFPGAAMVVPESEFQDVVDASHAVVREAQEAGVLVYAGGLSDEPPVTVAADGSVRDGGYPESDGMSGGYTIVDVATRDEALRWAAKTAAACRCPQELREFMPDEHR